VPTVQCGGGEVGKVEGQPLAPGIPWQISSSHTSRIHDSGAKHIYGDEPGKVRRVGYVSPRRPHACW
jgi:hypothetical protein